MRVADKNISSIGDIDSIREVGDAFAPGDPSVENSPLMKQFIFQKKKTSLNQFLPNSSYEDSFLCENNNIVALQSWIVEENCEEAQVEDC